MDPGKPRAEALAVRGDRIVAVGTVSEIEALRGPQTKVIDADGRFVMPGFNDAHIHLLEGGMQLDNVDLKDASSPAEFARRIGERARATPKGEWILGGNWDEQAWTPATLPSKELIDPVTPDTPAFVDRYDLHMALANSVALKLAGVTAKTPDPPGGTIVRDARGNPTGLLKDAAKGVRLQGHSGPDARTAPSRAPASPRAHGIARHHERPGHGPGSRRHRDVCGRRRSRAG